MISMIFKGDDEHSMFPRILSSGIIGKEKLGYMMLATDFSGFDMEAEALTGQMSCISIAEKIAKLE